MSAPVSDLRTSSRTPRQRIGPLAGIRITDFGWVGVGALATRLLADFGAEVIKIEDRERLDLMRRMPFYKGEQARPVSEQGGRRDPDLGGAFNNYNRNKLGVTLDMRTPEGRDLCERLIAKSDVVSENFAPEVMERWGLTYDRLREIRPDIIYARMSGFGHSGPFMGYRSYGPVVQAVSGHDFISGLPNREPSGWGFSYLDNMPAYFASSAIMTAIFNRIRTGEGAEIDVSAVEVGVALLGPGILDVAVNRRSSYREGFPTGNRLEHPAAAPHGVYPCAGEDRWCAIAVFTDDEWARLREAMENPDWSGRPEFATLSSRVANQDALDECLAGWTRGFEPHELMHLLQRHGIRAGAVQNGQDLSERDEQIAARGTFFELDHPVIGPAKFEGVPVKWSRTEPDNWRSGPLLGEDNDYVFREVVGLDEDEYAALRASGVIS